MTKFAPDNPALPFLRALESNYDPLAKGSDKATLFQRSTVRGNLAAQGWAQLPPVERAQEALITSLDKRGKVDIRFMAKISSDTSAKGKVKGSDSRIVIGWSHDSNCAAMHR